MILNFAVDALDEPAAQRTWGDEQRFVGGFRCVSRELVEQARDVLTNLLVTGDNAEVFVESCGGRVVVAGADVRVTAQLVAFAAHYQGELAVGFQSDQTVDHMHARAFEFARPGDISFLVEPCLNLNECDNLFACFGGFDQRIDNGGVATGTVEGLLDSLYLRVGRRLRKKRLHTGGEGIVGVVQKYIVIAGRGKHVRLFGGFGGVKPAGGMRNMLGVVQRGTVGAHDRAHTAQIQRRGELIYFGVVDIELRNKQVKNRGVDRIFNLKTHGRAETAAQQLLFESLQQVLGIVLFNLKVFVTGYAEDMVLNNLHAGEERVKVLCNDNL